MGENVVITSDKLQEVDLDDSGSPGPEISSPATSTSSLGSPDALEKGEKYKARGQKDHRNDHGVIIKIALRWWTTLKATTLVSRFIRSEDSADRDRLLDSEKGGLGVDYSSLGELRGDSISTRGITLL